MEPRSETVAVLTPTGGDAIIARRLLEKNGFHTQLCMDMRDVHACVDDGVGVVIIAEEALREGAHVEVLQALDAQPSWSDLPVLLLLAQGELSRAIPPRVVQLATRGNVTLLERPIRVATLVTTLRSALRARARQYDIRDSIAQRTAAAEVLRESEGRLRAAVLAAPYPLMLHTDDGTVLQLSRAWSKLSGYDASELTTTSEWLRLAFGDSDNGLSAHPADRPPGVLAARGERGVRTRDGSYRTWDFQSVGLGRLPDGRQLQLVAATDVTEFKRLLDSERTAREEAEAANRAKMDFLAMMSHELRTPLNAIAGYAQLLELGVHGPLTTPQRDAIARIMRSEAHLLGLIEDVLNFAKIEAGRVTFTPTPITLEELIASVEVLVEPQMKTKGIAYRRETIPEALAFADVEKTRQVLLNLLSNAVKFTQAGGRISIGVDARENEVDICITDTGIGIPDDKQGQVFEPFVQVERAYTSTQGGTGLGLAISRDLARAMGGDLTLKSKAAKGSTFTLTLPRALERQGIR